MLAEQLVCQPSSGLSLQSPVRALSGKKSSILSRIKTANFQSSTKIEALRQEIHLMREADPSAKCIVFSQFTSMLDLMAFRLQQVRFALLLDATVLWVYVYKRGFSPPPCWT